jgi:hypothetical protein
MAGAGYKLFATGDVLTAAEVNTYLQQQVTMVFANSTARTTALSGVLAEGMMSYLQDTNTVEVYNGSNWVNVGNTGDVTEVQAGTGISVADGTGPIPIVTNTMATEITAKGDLIVGTGSGTFDNLPAGTNGYTLVADSSVSPTGLKWAAPASPSFVGAIAYGAVNLSFGTTATVLSSLTSEIVDTNGFHSTSTNTERMTIPSGYDGKYLINLDTNLASTASMQNIYLRLRKNGSNVTEGLTNGNLATILSGLPQDGHFNVSMIVTAVAGDYFDFTLQTGASSSTTDKVRYSIAYLGA